jgi:hypothetical protein
MKRYKEIAGAVLSLAASIGAGSVGAAQVVGASPPQAAPAPRPGPGPGAGPGAAADAARPHADDSSSLRQGVITGVRSGRGEVEINGSWLKVAEGRTQVFRGGRAAKRQELEVGDQVRFTLAPSDASRGTLGAVYVP